MNKDQRIEALVADMLVLSSYIWRNPEMNACGMGGDATAVKIIEAALKRERKTVKILEERTLKLTELYKKGT